jgi:predicted NAD/FAD-dependent oxidoreductase
MKIAVIGAGMAGLTVARNLQALADVTLFDKSKGTGGRLSSRSFAEGWIDHGAPFFSADSQDFLEFLHTHIATDVLKIWQPSLSGLLTKDERVRYIGLPRNSAVTRALLNDLRFQPSTRIARLEQCQEGWRLFNDGDTLLGIWQQVVIAVPAPQALVLVRDQPHLAGQICHVEMEPCWVAAIQAGSKLEDVTDLSDYEHPVIRRIVCNSAKPMRQNENLYVVQATKDWSKDHLEETADWVGKEMLQSFCSLVSTAGNCNLLFVHRWRYALAEIAMGKPCLWDNQLKLGVCGDWCLGQRVEDAWQSGTELARRMLQDAK